jgi:phosphate transport system permease protein
MLFGAPLALLAAIYTSEFMHPAARAAVKPIIEMMASLPSVVLGFLAALVFAPVVERFVPATLASFFTIPLAFLAAAHLWQMIPQRRLLILQRYRLAFLAVILIPGFVAALLLGPFFEWFFFAGDIMLWLDGQIGTGVGAWFLLWLPLCAMGCVLVNATYLNPWLRPWTERLRRGQFAVFALAKFLVLVASTLAFAYGISCLLQGFGWDPRGTYVDTYMQRNALVVGFVMGFAVIPIIYTLADDALKTVPEHLRSASLACGATPWQTTMRIVVPTAMSGLFSALMIGLGRAVGETMIVLMAGGNTPVTKWNIFEGFRTLSANIAVELPEAVKDSTHFRTLFLAALTLLIMTFFINTLAEVVRLRFRRRAYQL